MIFDKNKIGEGVVVVIYGFRWRNHVVIHSAGRAATRFLRNAIIAVKYMRITMMLPLRICISILFLLCHRRKFNFHRSRLAFYTYIYSLLCECKTNYVKSDTIVIPFSIAVAVNGEDARIQSALNASKHSMDVGVYPFFLYDLIRMRVNQP